MSNIDEDEALFEDLYGDDEQTTSNTEVKPTEEKSAEPTPVEETQEPAKETEESASPEVSAAPEETNQPQQDAQQPQEPQPEQQQQQTPQATPDTVPQPPQQATNAPGQQQFDPSQFQGYQQFPGMPPLPSVPGMPPQGFPGMQGGAMPPVPPAPQVQHEPSQVGKDSGKMFIGGLNWDTTEEGLVEYFSKFGEVSDYTIMKDTATGRSRGFGFLTFKDPKSVDEVIKTDHILDGKLIDPKRAIAREEQDRIGKIFVGGIDPMVNEKEFYDFFAQYGSIIDAQLMIDKDTGRSRGFGFITYDSPDAVDRVTVNKYLSLKGKAMEVKRAEPRGQHQQNVLMQQQQQQQQNYYNQYGGASYGQMYPQATAAASTGNMYGQQVNPAMNQEYMRYYQWFMYQQAQQAQQAAAATAAGQSPTMAESQPAQQPLNPQQQANDPEPEAQQDYNNEERSNHNDDYDNPHRDQRRMNVPKGPRRSYGQSGPRGRGGYHRRGRGYHPYSRGGRR
ncbi:uncharacterized protein J8A68_005933 [[Candida] subhashii]|uniref:RRM domain-containing protein n=1 Tax=[Candida] subhashii TaxID=561895 RepID=A0A8J5UU77_9ASCO|nr:uncharacterized protein J8A68_005933 [[Candida] subhashii]KAG7660514.1 hypothetical protein J8A68_005933 [[Candida] subhashii]